MSQENVPFISSLGYKNKCVLQANNQISVKSAV